MKRRQFLHLAGSAVGSTAAVGTVSAAPYAHHHWPIIRSGEREAVYTIQYLLEEHGYDLQYHDGIYGSETSSTVEAFQRDHDVDVTQIATYGTVGPATWEALLVPVYGPDQDPYWATYAVQHFLTYEWGISISVDGYYGPETKNAIEAFQREVEILVDGLVGPQTWRAIAYFGY